MKANGPTESISHSFRGILEARDTRFTFRLAGENTHTAGLVRRVEERERTGDTPRPSRKKMREALFVLRHTSVRQCQVSTSGARARDGSLSLAKTSRDFRYISSTLMYLAICTPVPRAFARVRASNRNATVTMSSKCDGGEVNKTSCSYRKLRKKLFIARWQFYVYHDWNNNNNKSLNHRMLKRAIAIANKINLIFLQDRSFIEWTPEIFN